MDQKWGLTPGLFDLVLPALPSELPCFGIVVLWGNIIIIFTTDPKMKTFDKSVTQTKLKDFPKQQIYFMFYRTHLKQFEMEKIIQEKQAMISLQGMAEF